MSLWLYLRFPQLPLECQPLQQDYPAVVIERQRVIAVNDEAQLTGLKPGQSTATVRALVDTSQLQLLERDASQEVLALERLECWAYSITPTLERWQTEGLQLEVGRCLKLYGGLTKLFNNIQSDLEQRGFTVRSGLAPNRSAAWLLSHWDENCLCPSDQNLRQRLDEIPLHLLRKAQAGQFLNAIKSLEKAGIQTLGEILNMPASALGRRCGQAFQKWLGDVTATSDNVTQDFHPPHRFYDCLWFGFEIRNQTELHPTMQQLLHALARFCRTTQHQPTHIEWQMLRMHGDTDLFEVRSSEAHDDPEIWFELSRLSLEQYSLGADIEGLALHVHQFQTQNAIVTDLFGESHNREPLHNLVDRLRSRLGLQAINQIALREAHLPEHSQYLSQDIAPLPPSLAGQAQRPFWLFDEPHPIRVKDDVLHWNGVLTLLLGPERLEDNWWQKPASRDYYIAQTQAGQPIWIFEDRYSKQWYVQGILP
jgi:protein ImuB